MSELLVSVIIPTLNRDKVIVDTIQAFLNNDYPRKEIIVVDQSDGHDEPTLSYLNSIKNRISYYHISDWKNAPKAKNYGFNKSRGDIIIFVDDDIEIDSLFIGNHVAAHQQTKMDIIGGTVTEKKDFELIRGAHLTKTGKVVIVKGDSPLSLDGFMGGNVSYSRQAISAIKGYDTQFLGNAMREETDAALRARAAGYSIGFTDKANIVHLAFPSGGTRTNRKLPVWYFNLFHNEALFFFRHFPATTTPAFLLRMLRPFFASWFYYGKGNLAYPVNCVKGLVGGYRAAKRPPVIN